MKRIFSIFLALVLVITAVPFLGVEAKALGLDEEGTYTITYKPGSGAKGSSKKDTFEPGEEAVLRSADDLGFSKEGYYFTGWQIGNKKYSAGSSFNSNGGDHTATAQWKKEGSSSSSSSSSTGTTKETYTVTYKPGAAGGSSVKKTYDYDENFTLISCPFEYKDHSFVGWEYGNGNVYDAGQGVSAPNMDVTFTAKWSSEGIKDITGSSSSSS